MQQKFLQLMGFAKKGLNSDIMPWDLPGDFVTDIQNIRITNNKLAPFGGVFKWEDLPVGFYPGFIMHVGSRSGEYWIIAGRGTGAAGTIYAYNGSTFTDISNPLAAGYTGIGPGDESLWTGCMLGDIPVITHPNHFPEYWDPQDPGVDMQFLPWDAGLTWQQAGQQCGIIRSHKSYLIALKIVNTGTEERDTIRWSSPADINSVPETWDPLDVTNLAGYVPLGGDGGETIDGLSMRDAFCIYRENAISIMDYQGGQFVWRIRHLSTTVGAVSPESIQEVNGVHYLIGDGDILANDGNSIQSLLHDRIRRRFISDLNVDYFLNSYTVKHSLASEVWFCIPYSATNAEFPNLAYIYNWRDDTWSLRDMPESPHVNYGPVLTGIATWETIGGTWQGQSSPWNSRQFSPLNEVAVGVDQPDADDDSGRLLIYEGTFNSKVSSYDSKIERTDFALEGLNNVTTITRVYPHIRGEGIVKITLGSHQFPGAPVTWKAPVEFDPTKDRKVDIRTTGELHAFRLEGLNQDSRWEFSGMDIEYVYAGNR